MLGREVGIVLNLLWGLSQVVIKGYDTVKWGELMVTRGYYINIIEMRGHTPPPTCSQKGGALRPLLRRGVVSRNNVPPLKRMCACSAWAAGTLPARHN